jgi:hypothetical protein
LASTHSLLITFCFLFSHYADAQLPSERDSSTNQA